MAQSVSPYLDTTPTQEVVASKPCLVCGELFDWPSNRTKQQWMNRRCCSPECAQEARRRSVIGRREKREATLRVFNPLVEELVRVVAAEHGLTPEDVFGRGRSKTVAAIRHYCMREARRLYDYSFSELGKFFGRDHTTVMSAMKSLPQQTATGPIVGPTSSSTSNAGSGQP